MKSNCCLLASALVVLLAPPVMAQDLSKTFSELNRKYEAAVNNHDSKAWSALFADDAILVPAGTPIIQGRDNIQKWGEEATKVWNTLSVADGPVRGNDTVGWIAGTWAGNINTPDGKTMDLTGNYLTVAQKQGSQWLLIADSWNINPPPQAMTGSSTPPK